MLNGSGEYGFWLSARAGARPEEADRLRVQVTDRATGALVYDNQPGAGERLDPVPELAGGSIVVHASSESRQELRTEASSEVFVPMTYALRGNWPNPFRSRTTISFDLPRRSWVRLEIYDVAGRRVRRLADREMPAGRSELQWSGRSEDGMPAGSGVYYCRFRARPAEGGEEFVQVARMIWLR